MIVTSWWTMRHAKARKCKPATVAGKRTKSLTGSRNEAGRSSRRRPATTSSSTLATLPDIREITYSAFGAYVVHSSCDDWEVVARIWLTE